MATHVKPKVRPMGVKEIVAKKPYQGRAHKYRIRALTIYALSKKNMTLEQIGECMTPKLTRERVRQIMSEYGWKTALSGRVKAYPRMWRTVCKRCKTEFSFRQLHSHHTKMYCSHKCKAHLSTMGKACLLCRTDRETTNNPLTKLGFHTNGAQRWIHRKCNRKRVEKYGRYPKDRAKYNAYAREWHRKRKEAALKAAV